MTGFNLVMMAITITTVVGAVMIVRGLTRRCEKVLEGIDRVGDLLDLKPLQDFQNRLDASAQLLTAHEKDIKGLKAQASLGSIEKFAEILRDHQQHIVTVRDRVELHNVEILRLNRLRGQIAVALELSEPAKE